MTTMASRSTRHALTCIGLAHGIADSIEQSYPDPPRTVRAHVDRIRSRCMDCFALWPDPLERRELNAISGRMEALEHTIIDGRTDVAVMTSVALALLSDLHDVVRPGKRSAIAHLLSACQQTHRYYDRRLDKWAAYDAARDAVANINAN